MHRYEILPHTADVIVRAFGSTRAGLLISALQGMFSAAEPARVPKAEKIERSFALKAADFPSLLTDMLNEALYLSDVHHEAYEDVKFTLVTDTKAEGAFVGHAVSGFGTEIKAATHHDLTVQKIETGAWEATITFDV